MKYHWTYETPDGFDDIVMVGDDEALTGLSFKGSRGECRRGVVGERRLTAAFREMCRWLDEYFAGQEPDLVPPFRIEGATPFRRDVIGALMKIPFGATVSYGDIARRVSRRCGGAKVSARAVGGAVGWNPICIVVPCHRVVGAGGGLVGYGGGLPNKAALLAHERARRSGRILVSAKT
jgi:methylated-DNA-[protein]-cysteine S-methyltransferase